MPRPHISMRKIRDVVRLALHEGLSLRQTAASLQIPVTTVADHVRRAKAAGLSWPLPEGLDDVALEACCSPLTPARQSPGPCRTGPRCMSSCAARTSL